MTAPKTETYICNQNVRHKGKLHGPNTEIELTKDEAASVGKAVRLKEVEAEQETKPKAPAKGSAKTAAKEGDATDGTTKEGGDQ